MKKLTLNIPNMQSSHCQARVRIAVEKEELARISNIQAGSLELELDSDENQKFVIQAIEAAGYTIAGLSSEIQNTYGEIFTFKTNINCDGCVDKVSPALDAADGISHWDVDIKSKDKILSIHSDGISREAVIETIEKTGFKIEALAE